MYYDLKIELASFVVITIIFLNVFWDKALDERRNRLFKSIVYLAFVSILNTLITTYTAENFTAFPLWIIEITKTIYFILLPSSAVVVFFYALSLRKFNLTKAVEKNLMLLFLLPYVVYVFLAISNYWLNNFFTISPQLGYVRGPLYQLAYPISFMYIAGIFIVAIFNRHETNSGIGFVLCINMIVVTGITLIQFFYSHLILSGLSNVAGVLIVYLYVQNVAKSRDSLTGLYNRDRFTFDLSKKINNTRRSFLRNESSKNFTLVVFSIRSMKAINERYGLERGSRVIEAVGKYLRMSFSSHTVYRYSGDEFALIINSPDGNLDERLITVVKKFEEPLKVGFKSKDILVGIVFARVDFPTFGDKSRTLVTALDYSISSVKKGLSKTNYMYDISVYTTMSRRNKILEKLKGAIKNDGFEVHYQPIYSTAAKCFRNAEALIRMKPNDDEQIFPSEFIPIAEKTGLIIPITYIVLEKVCADIRQMLDTYSEDMPLDSVSINFPYVQFLETEMIGIVSSILEKHSIPPSMIKIEITERVLIVEAGIVHDVMCEMQEKGFVFELDDFGVDYSNMSMVLDLPVEIIKIDRSLVLSAAKKKFNKVFFEHFIKTIKATERIIIVEGVETEDQAVFFENCGCEYIQGYYYAKPLNFHDFVAFLLKKC